MKEKPNSTRTYDADGFRRRAACLCVRDGAETETVLAVRSDAPVLDNRELDDVSQTDKDALPKILAVFCNVKLPALVVMPAALCLWPSLPPNASDGALRHFGFIDWPLAEHVSDPGASRKSQILSA
ncbi:diphosphoinositol polyphosphate phosphohydrolase 1-like [Tropilaelaps mercedesae]|uniref:Diphosphoinositol polyphosphate phosphohydrolase 1-like n=1 Tax=Tropilaelaps mercedesae TaxID=418985 RepID=A0A1V9XAH4_9ACAR|nr:diphosphoinositol polyphosphate phosphohydrolase 1-like [Tropilaelaps mercedesae]